jgi:hypothetical protein
MHPHDISSNLYSLTLLVRFLKDSAESTWIPNWWQWFGRLCIVKATKPIVTIMCTLCDIYYITEMNQSNKIFIFLKEHPLFCHEYHFVSDWQCFPCARFINSHFRFMVNIWVNLSSILWSTLLFPAQSELR